MTEPIVSQKEKANTSNQHKQLSLLKNNLYTMIAAFSGVALGVLATFGYMSSYLHSQLASQTAAINHQIVSMRPADLTSAQAGLTSNTGANICAAPLGSTVATAAAGNIFASAGQLTPAQSTTTTSTTTPSTPSAPVTPAGPTTTFVSKLVSGILAPENLTISNTGTSSKNTITASNQVETTLSNTNDINLSTSNSQTSSSGSATTTQNTTGGSATSGSSTNNNSTSMSVDVNN